jgi:hypothetical protein
MLGAIGCAHQSPVTSTAAPPPRPRIKLAVMPLDDDPFPQVAATLNSALRNVKVKGVDDYFVSKVTLEVVQLSIECVQPTSACYTAVGKSLSANRLLLAHVAGIHKRRRDRSVRVTITMFDVDAGEAVNVVDHIYKTPELAAGGAGDLVLEAAGAPPIRFGPEEDPQGQRASGPVAREGRR